MGGLWEGIKGLGAVFSRAATGALSAAFPTTMGDSSGIVTSYRAPTLLQGGTDIANGSAEGGIGLFMTVNKAIAVAWAENRRSGIFIVSTDARVFSGLAQTGGIIPDPNPDYAAHSFVVTPGAIPTFVSSSHISYVPYKSPQFYEDFIK